MKKMLHSHYNLQLDNDYFSIRYNKNSKSDTGTVEERIDDFMKTIKVDTLMFKYESNVYISKNYISIGIEGVNTLGFTRINIAPEDNPLCFNILFYENRKFDPKECFNYKEGKIDAWKEFFAYNSGNPHLNKPYIFDKNQSEFFPIDFFQYSEDMICLYFNFLYDYGNSVFGCFMLKDLEQYFDINYLNEKPENK